MQLRSREEKNPSNLSNNAHLRVKFDGFLWARLLTSIGLNILSSSLPARSVPFVIIVDVRVVTDCLAPVSWMKRHSVLGFNFINREPPVNLAGRSRIPGVTMRVEGVGDT